MGFFSMQPCLAASDAFDFDLVFDFGFWGQGVSPCRISELTPTGEMKKYSRSLYFMKNR